MPVFSAAMTGGTVARDEDHEGGLSATPYYQALPVERRASPPGWMGETPVAPS